MLGFSDRTGLHLADDDSELAVGIHRDLVQPLISDPDRGIMEHGHKLLIKYLLDFLLLLDRCIGISDHHQSEVVIGLLDHSVGDDLGYVVDDTGDISPLRYAAVPVVDDIVHTALDTSHEAKSLLHIAVRLVEGSVVDQGELCLVQRCDHHHSFRCRTCQVFVVDIDYEQVAVDLIILLAGDSDDAGAGLAHSVRVDEAGAEYIDQQGSGRLIEHLSERRVEGGLVQVQIVLLDIFGNAHQEILVVVQIVGLVGVDLIYERLGVHALLDRIGHIFAAQNAELLNKGIIFLDRSVQGVGTAHGLSRDGIEAAVSHRAQPVGDDVGILFGRDQYAQRSSGGSGGGRYMPVFIFLRVFLCLFIHPVAELVLGQERELIEIFGTMIIVRRRAALFETRAVERNLVSSRHQLMNAFVLLFQNPLIVFGVDRLFFYRCIGSQRIYMLQFMIQFVVIHMTSFVGKQLRSSADVNWSTHGVLSYRFGKIAITNLTVFNMVKIVLYSIKKMPILVFHHCFDCV